MTPQLRVRDLSVEVRSQAGRALAVDRVSFDLAPGEVLGIVGESGCGKSLTVLSILNLLPRPAARIVGGSIILDGRDLLRLDPAEMRRVRGGQIGMIFQEPLTSLNPLFTIGHQIAEAIRVHEGLGRRAALDRAVGLLARVSITDDERRLAQYPHEISGGMRQRVMIATALACGPRILVADEPTTALDVTIQAQILGLLRRLQRDLGMAVLRVTHDLGVIASVADRVMVMYAGRCVEVGPVAQILEAPAHPYTQGLVRCAMSVDRASGPLDTIAGSVPAVFATPPGCSFAPRCALAHSACTSAVPPFHTLSDRHAAACWNYHATAPVTGGP
jgi:oligopeptide/dipeptide ABC transporter ATP-binding protein